MLPPPPRSTLFPYTTLFRSSSITVWSLPLYSFVTLRPKIMVIFLGRSEEHTSELQSRGHLVCRLLLEKKKNSDVPILYPENYNLMALLFYDVSIGVLVRASY